MIRLAQVIIDGTLVGLLYGLVAVSFVVIYRAARIINIAQGEVLAISAFLLWTFTLGQARLGLHLPLIVGILLALVACVGVGLALERLVFRPLIGQPAFAIFMAAIALVVTLRGATQLIWSAESRPFPDVLPAGAWQFGPFLVSARLLVGAILTVALATVLHVFFTRFRHGLRLAAVAEDHVTALSLGISIRGATAVAWTLGTVVASCAALVLLSGRVVSLDVATIGFKALPVALLGGLESVRGAPLAGALIGIGEALAMAYLDPFTNGVASNVLPFAVMIAVLLIRPQGLFGWKRIERI